MKKIVLLSSILAVFFVQTASAAVPLSDQEMAGIKGTGLEETVALVNQGNPAAVMAVTSAIVSPMVAISALGDKSPEMAMGLGDKLGKSPAMIPALAMGNKSDLTLNPGMASPVPSIGIGSVASIHPPMSMTAMPILAMTSPATMPH